MPTHITRDTERLSLRPLTAGDAEALLTLLSDERVVRYMLFPVFTRERVHTFLERIQQAPESQVPRQVVVGITERGQGHVAGLFGFVIDTPGEQAEAWYLLHPDLWGRGLVTEAARAMVDEGFSGLSLHRIWATCLPENPGSARVLEKLGFRREGLLEKNLRIHGEWRDSYLYALLANEWRRDGR